MLLLASRPCAVVQDYIDCADLARASGLDQAASILSGLAALHLGFSPATIAWLANPDRPFHGFTTAHRGSTSQRAGDVVDVAIEQLSQLMRSRPMLGKLPDSSASTHSGGMSIPQRPEAIRAQIEPLAGQAKALLTSIMHAEREVTTRELRSIADTLFNLEPLRLDEHLDATYEERVSLFALEQLRRFIVANAELLFASGEPPLFSQVSALASASLGPYFSNMWRLIRTPCDVLALIDAAANGQADEQQMSLWCILLSVHLREHELVGLIEDLGNRGMVGTLRALLDRLQRAIVSARCYEAVRRIRDVSLDLGDFALAAEAQALIASWRPADAVSWEVLGEIQATAGECGLADKAFATATLLDPSNRAILRKRGALQAGTLPLVQRGYSSSAHMARLRRARALALDMRRAS
ncbi:hypothetical protein [Sphingomonas sp.]|uniref:hypothetical protein n=1 Tax=Sphingomonas sp. TaxID=28214 RepID=UPI003B3B9E0E